MDQFEYKILFINHKINISKEMIEYNGKTIPTPSVEGIGIELIDVAKVAVGQAVGGAIGGLIGGMIKAKGLGDRSEINKSGSLKDLPNSRGQLLITHKPDGQKMKVQRIPINTADENCRKMLEKIVETHKAKFIGYGPQALIEKELNISHKATLIFVAIVVIAAIAFSIWSAIQGY